LFDLTWTSKLKKKLASAYRFLAIFGLEVSKSLCYQVEIRLVCDKKRTNHSSKLPDLSCTEIIKNLISQESIFAKSCAYKIIALVFI